jgi:hypothetical protein
MYDEICRILNCSKDGGRGRDVSDDSLYVRRTSEDANLCLANLSDHRLTIY